jgi:hypothetical protein
MQFTITINPSLAPLLHASLQLYAAQLRALTTNGPLMTLEQTPEILCATIDALEETSRQIFEQLTEE